MALPEQQPESPPDQQVTEIPETPEIPAAVEQGITTTPSTPTPVTGDDNQTIAQPVPPPPGDTASITIPAASQISLTQMAKGNAANSQTWFGVFWLFKIKKALKEGLQVLFGGKQ